jgi:PTS system mannose-specific IID component
VRRALFWRGFAVQGSGNYETLIGTGFAFALLPALRHVYRDDPEALRAAAGRQSELFNSHPYLATVALGAVARLEAEHADPVLIARFKMALRGPLGALGDQLIWLTWRPMCALLGLVVLFLGAPWWAAVLVFLVPYNALHLWLRVRGLRIGLESGLAVAGLLRASPLQLLSVRTADVGAVLVGAATVLAVDAGAAGLHRIDVLLLIAAALAGIIMSVRAWRVIWIVLTLGWAAGVVAGFITRMTF